MHSFYMSKPIVAAAPPTGCGTTFGASVKRLRLRAAAPRLGSVLLAAMAGSGVPGASPAQSPHQEKPPPPINVISWPGFSTALQNGRYVVAFVEPARKAKLPPAGARLVSCDGHPAQQLARERLCSDATDGAARLLWDTGDRSAPPVPDRCIFETGNGQAAYRLEYSVPTAPALAAALAAAAGQSRSPPRLRLF